MGEVEREEEGDACESEDDGRMNGPGVETDTSRLCTGSQSVLTRGGGMGRREGGRRVRCGAV